MSDAWMGRGTAAMSRSEKLPGPMPPCTTSMDLTALYIYIYIYIYIYNIAQPDAPVHHQNGPDRIIYII